MRRIIARLRGKDDGVAMVWLATTLVLLLGTSGFAVDLGWMYLNASRAQRAADAAAMAGVVHLPGFLTQAQSDAEDAARANGYDVGLPGSVDSLTTTPLSDNELQATLGTEIDSFFLKVLGFDHFDITRTATAQYIKPVPLGSPNRCFGQDPTGTFCTANINDFWAAVSGPYTGKTDGDPYSTRCLNIGGNASSCGSANVEYNRAGAYGGYYYAVEVASGVSDIDINIYDAGWDERNSYPDIETADARYSPGSGNPGLTTNFQLHNVDSTPSDPTDNPTLAGCNWTIGPDTYPSGSFYKNAWRTLCTLGGAVTPGVYVLHVFTSGTGSGSNHFSVAADADAGADPRVYGINDMSIFSNNLTAASKLYLVEVEEEHAGSKLELRFFDAGDASGRSWMRVIDPHGNIPHCDWISENAAGSQTDSGSEPCEWETTLVDGTKVFNNQWITAYIDIPDTYTCNGSDCFWYMELELTQPNERTTWRARVIGNPVRLIP